jgi:hypothetical protein
MTTCQIAFSFKNRVICIEEFSLNTPNVFQKMKASASQYIGGDATDIVLETMSAGSHVTINSDQDAAKYIFGCAVDGRAKIKVKIARKPKREHSRLSEFKSDTVMEKPASTLVDQSFIRKVIELLDQWADVEISYEDTCALVEALKARVLQRDPLEALIGTLARYLQKEEFTWTVPILLNRYDSWIAMASQEELLYVAEQVPTVLDKLVSRRGKLFEDVFIKQKPLNKILKIRLPKSKNRGRKLDLKEGSRFQYLRKGNFEETDSKQSRPSPNQDQKHVDLNELHVPLEVKQEDSQIESSSDEEKIQKREVNFTKRMEKTGRKTAEESEVLKAVNMELRRNKAKKEDSHVEAPNEEEHETEKTRKREARLAKRMEKTGCKTAEELQVLKAVDKELRRVQDLQKYGCSTEEELKLARKQERLAKQLARNGCQDENELSKVKLAKKLERYGCETVEELNALKKQRRISKYNTTFSN